jgi:sugar/nucleoside kinase (ribokinase family)
LPTVPDLLVLGDCNPDLVLAGGDVVPEFGQREKRVGDARLVVGGSGAIMACGAARLGVATAFVGAVGDDLFGRFMLDALAERGVDASACPVEPGAATGLTVALVRGEDRAMLTAPGAIPTLRSEQVDRGLLRRARHLHIASYYFLDGLHAGLPALVDEAHAAGLTVSLDPQGDPAGAWRSGLPELLPALDVLLVNEHEHAGLAPDACPLVVVKRGRRGAAARSAGGWIEVAAPAVDVVDASGAGDSFDAGFVAGWLAGLPLADALRLACACGALSTRALGGTAAQPTLDEARAVAA